MADGLAWKPDVIFLYETSWGAIPADLAGDILKRVRAGAGLVGWQSRFGEGEEALAKALGAGPVDVPATDSILSCVPGQSRHRFVGTQARGLGQAGRFVRVSSSPAKGLFSYLHD